MEISQAGDLNNKEMHLKSEQVLLTKLAHEKERLATFTDWPLPFIKKETLARYGFYYKGKNDNVICVFCGIELGFWEEGDDPVEEHRKHSPKCKLLERLRTDSVRNRPPKGEDECGCVIGNRTAANRYDTLQARFDSFEDWPISMKQTKKLMAEAGFFYSGIGDKVICFTCGVGVHKWEEDDDPWVEHAKWNPHCEYVLRKKGEDFMNKNDKKKIRLRKVKEQIVADKPPVHEQLLCSVCKSEVRTIVSMPCRHLATCKTCNSNLTTCPICRTEEEKTIEVLIP
ncbi:inhibitor of apoptosis [Holotrichia oblita]|uniref:Inhibitor of apoptosis n=1 Tax=Holotrichia oblita TaxID=644536 RepID=A0ACB9SUH3_HOLOL|nr:inhibitor of apoptosis [Holotrichia oblita]